MLPFGQQLGGIAKEEADAVVKHYRPYERARPMDTLDIFATADTVITNQPSTAVSVGRELGFKMETSFPCRLHAFQHQSLLLLEAIDAGLKAVCMSMTTSTRMKS